MAHTNETDYYRRRHEQERALAEQAVNPEARMVHSQLAKEYARRLGLLDRVFGRRKSPNIRLVETS